MCIIIQKIFSILGKYRLKDCSSTTAPRQLLLDNCSSTTAPRQLLLRCPTTVHPWTYALPYYRPSVDICVVLLPSISGHMRCPTTVHQWTYALSYYRRPSLDISNALIRPPWMVEGQILQEQISARPSMGICSALLPAIRPTWQRLFLQSYCISSIHGGQMWEVWKMQGSIFNHGSICSFKENQHCYEIAGLFHG